MRPLPAVGARQRGARGPIGARNSGDDTSLRVVTPPDTTGLTKGGSRRRSMSRLASLSTSTLACCILLLSPRFALDLYIRVLTPPSSTAGSAHSTRITRLLTRPSRLLAPPTAFLTYYRPSTCPPSLPVSPAYYLDQCGARAEPGTGTKHETMRRLSWWDRSAERPPKRTG